MYNEKQAIVAIGNYNGKAMSTFTTVEISGEALGSMVFGLILLPLGFLGMNFSILAGVIAMLGLIKHACVA